MNIRVVNLRVVVRVVALLTFACLRAEPSVSRIGLYYSFDTPPSPGTFRQMQAELSQIMDPAGVRMEWREIGVEQAEEFRDIFVVRFHGSCAAAGAEGATTGRILAETKISDGRVLPFADVQCDLVRRYLGSATGGDGLLGRALARVTAHELYHMITASAAHLESGIARAEYTRDNLTARRFQFGKNEAGLLRQWAGPHAPTRAPEPESGSADESDR